MNRKRLRVGLCHMMRQVVRGVGIASLLGVLAVQALAWDPQAPGSYHFPAPGFFADGLTAESGWEQILKPSKIVPQFPLLNLGNSFVPLSALCVDGDSVRIADARIDNGVSIPASQVRNQARALSSASGYAAMRAKQTGVGNVVVAGQPLQAEAPDSVIRYPVSVYKVVTLVGLGVPWYMYLFDKPWEVPTCANRTN